DLFQFFASDKDPARFRSPREQKISDVFADLEDRPEQNRSAFENAAEPGERAKGKSSKERFGQNAEDKKIKGQGNREREKESQNAETGDEELREQEQTDDVRKVRHEKDSDEQALRLLREPIKP